MRRSFTVQDLESKFGYPCEICKFFDVNYSECEKRHRPRRYILEDGPNEDCHARKKCKDFRMAKLDIGPGVRRAFNAWFSGL